MGVLVAYMIVDERVIVDPKVARPFNEDHLTQITGYLTIKVAAYGHDDSGDLPMQVRLALQCRVCYSILSAQSAPIRGQES